MLSHFFKRSFARKAFARFSTKSSLDTPKPPIAPPSVDKPASIEEQQYQDNQEFQGIKKPDSRWAIFRLFFWGFIGATTYSIYNKTFEDAPLNQDEVWKMPHQWMADEIIRINKNFIKYVCEPPVKKLLPDPLHSLIQKKTLVLNVNKTIIATKYEFGKGTIFVLRNGLEAFLNKMSRKYEIILFSDDDSHFLNDAMNFIDPRGQYVTAFFGRESLVYYQGRRIRDPSFLNREMSNIIVVDHSPCLNVRNLENTVIVPPCLSEKSDKELQRLSYLLDELASPVVKDIRTVLNKLGPNGYQTIADKMEQNQAQIKEKINKRVFHVGVSKKKENK